MSRREIDSFKDLFIWKKETIKDNDTHDQPS